MDFLYFALRHRQCGVVYFWQNIRPDLNTRRNLSRLGKDAPTHTQNGITFRGLNKIGKFAPQGKLPFELCASMGGIRKQQEDLPYDSENPLFPFGHGLSY